METVFLKDGDDEGDVNTTGGPVIQEIEDGGEEDGSAALYQVKLPLKSSWTQTISTWCLKKS